MIVLALFQVVVQVPNKTSMVKAMYLNPARLVNKLFYCNEVRKAVSIDTYLSSKRKPVGSRIAWTVAVLIC